MSAALAPAPRAVEHDVPSRTSLEELLSETVERSRAGEEVECPVCNGRMGRAGGAARCADCGSELT